MRFRMRFARRARSKFTTGPLFGPAARPRIACTCAVLEGCLRACLAGRQSDLTNPVLFNAFERACDAHNPTNVHVEVNELIWRVRIADIHGWTSRRWPQSSKIWTPGQCTRQSTWLLQWPQVSKGLDDLQSL